MSNTNIRTIKLGAPREIKIKNCPNLETLTVENLGNIESLTLIGNGKDFSRAATILRPKALIDEYPDIINSLQDTGKANWLKGDRAAYINTHLVFMKDFRSVDVDFIYNDWGNGYMHILGAYNNMSNYYTIAGWNAKHSIFNGASGSSYDGIEEIEQYKRYNVKMINNDEGRFIYLDGELVSSATPYTNFNVPEIYILGRNYQGNKLDNVSTNAVSKVIFYDKDNNKVLHLVPFIRNGKAGMIDLLTSTFYGNANTSGAFTIETTNN